MTAATRMTRLFTLRMWQEEAGEGQTEWRGKVQALPDGEAYYFRDWPGLIRRLEAMLPTGQSEISHSASQKVAISKKHIDRESDTMTTEEAMALINLAGRAWNEGKPELLDEVYTPGFLNHSNGLGREATKKALMQYREAFSDLHLTADDIIIGGDKIVIRGTTRGVHTGPYSGIPATGKRFEQAFINIIRVENGKFVEEWELKDDLGTMRQLGLLK